MNFSYFKKYLKKFEKNYFFLPQNHVQYECYNF